MPVQGSFDPDLTAVRRTFLRRHVGDQLARTADVMAVDGIRRRVEPLLPEDDGEARRRLASVLRLDHFFERHQRSLSPDVQVYFPLAVRPADGSDPGAGDLTALLRQLDENDDHRGVVLTTRSGAGKTVAARKAFLDCIFLAPGSDRPPLADFLPCWIDLAEPLDDGTVLEQRRQEYQQTPDLATLQRRTTDETVVLELLRHASGCRSAGLNRVRDWVRHGPKLLLFVDLNAADEATRVVAARALAHFQERYGETGHRAVASYRTTQPDESVIRGPEFRAYALASIERYKALAYLRNVRDFERGVFAQLRDELPGYAPELQPPDRDIDAEVAMLAELIDRYDRPACLAEASVVCTPLLMHLMSQLEPGAAGEIHSLTDLYHRVVNQHLEFDEEHYGPTRIAALPSTLCGPAGRARCKTAMTRVALLMHARNTNRLMKNAIEQAWDKPSLGKPGLIGSAAMPWQPVDDAEFAWSASPYCTAHFPSTEHAALMQYGFLRREGEAVRFLHDSFIDYFVGALALARPYDSDARPREEGLETGWFPAVTKRMHAAPIKHTDAALFLGGALNSEQLRELLLEIISTQGKEGWPALVASLLRGRGASSQQEADVVMDALHQAILHYGWAVHQWPESLFSTCYHHLETCETGEPRPVCKDFAARMRRRLSRPWLRPLFETYRPTATTMAQHSAGVSAAACFPDGRIISGDQDGVVKVWDVEKGTIITMPEQVEGSVYCLAVLDNDRVCVGHSGWGKVLLWDLSANVVQVIIDYVGSVYRLAVVSPDGIESKPEVVCGGKGGVLMRWTQDSGVTTRDEHGGAMHELITLPNGATACGYVDGTVRVWHDLSGPPATTLRHTSPIVAIKAYSQGQLVVASAESNLGGESAQSEIRIWNLDTQQVARSLTVQNEIAALDLLPDGRIAFACESGVVQVWNPPDGSLASIGSHSTAVTCLLVLSNTHVVTGDERGELRISNVQDVQHVTLQMHSHAISALRLLDSGSVLSASMDGSVAFWNPNEVLSGATLPPLHDGGVTALALLPDGKVVSSGQDHTVKVSQLTDAGLAPLRSLQENCATRMLLLSPSDLLTGHADGMLRIWGSDMNKVKELKAHSDAVSALARISEKSIASASLSGKVLIWHLAENAVEQIAECEGVVRALCVDHSNRILLFHSETRMHVFPSFWHHVWTDHMWVFDTKRHNEGPAETNMGVVARDDTTDGQCVSGWSDGAVCIEIESGNEVLSNHEGSVTCVLSIGQGCVASASGDRSIRVSSPALQQTLTVAVHGCKLTFTSGRDITRPAQSRWLLV